MIRDYDGSFDFIGCAFFFMLVGVGTLFAVFAVGIAFVAYLQFSGQTCYEKWADYNTEYSIAGGCRIEIDGTYIPEEWVYFQNGELTIRVTG